MTNSLHNNDEHLAASAVTVGERAGSAAWKRPHRLLSIEEVCDRTGLGTTSIYKLFAAGKLRKIKNGRKTNVPDVDVDDLIEALINESAAA